MELEVLDKSISPPSSLLEKTRKKELKEKRRERERYGVEVSGVTYQLLREGERESAG